MQKVKTPYLSKMLHPNQTARIERGHIPPVGIDIPLKRSHRLRQHPPRRNHRYIARHGLVSFVLQAQRGPGDVAPSVGAAQGGDVGVVGKEVCRFFACEDPAFGCCMDMLALSCPSKKESKRHWW